MITTVITGPSRSQGCAHGDADATLTQNGR